MALVNVGPYPFMVPDFFVSFDVRSADPLYAARAIVDQAVTFDFTFVLGRGTVDERDRMVAAMLESLAPERHHSTDVDVRGNPFTVHRLELGGGRSSEQYVGFAHGDLIRAAMTLPAADTREQSFRTLLESMVNAAIVRR